MPQTQIGNRYGVPAVGRTPGTAKVIRFTGTASGGNNFQLLVGSVLTANIPRLATATQLRDALRGVPAIGAAGCTATGGPLGTSPVDVTMAAKAAAFDFPLPIFTNVDLTGGTVTVAQQTAPSFEAWNNNSAQTLEDLDQILALAGFSQAYLDRCNMNDKLFMLRQVTEPWTIS